MKTIIKDLLLGLAFIWAFPVTILGLLFALICWARPLRISPQGVLFFSAKGKWLYKKFWLNKGFIATTLGYVTVWGDDEYAQRPQLVIHEGTHTWQAAVLGIFWPIFYGLDSLYQLIIGKDLYWDNWFEAQAYRAQKGDRSLWLWE